MTSGNLLADRRMEMAANLQARGDADAAIDLLQQALELAPGWAKGWFRLAGWQAAAARRDAAVAGYATCLRLDPEDRLGAVVALALLGTVAEPPALPPAYVAGVFDEYADGFEQALLGRLGYRVPAGLAELVGDVAGEDARYARVLDLGCGTGLAGERFRAAGAWLEGVDLSEGMIAQARRKALYDDLAVADVVTYLAAARGRYDLIVAADVLVYLGELSPLFAAAAAALVPGGRLAFSVEALPGNGFRLTAGHRYAHAEGYVRRRIEASGLVVEAVRPTTCRLEAGRPLAGVLVVARRHAAEDETQPTAAPTPGTKTPSHAT